MRSYKTSRTDDRVIEYRVKGSAIKCCRVCETWLAGLNHFEIKRLKPDFRVAIYYPLHHDRKFSQSWILDNQNLNQPNGYMYSFYNTILCKRTKMPNKTIPCVLGLVIFRFVIVILAVFGQICVAPFTYMD